MFEPKLLHAVDYALHSHVLHGPSPCTCMISLCKYTTHAALSAQYMRCIHSLLIFICLSKAPALWLKLQLLINMEDLNYLSFFPHHAYMPSCFLSWCRAALQLMLVWCSASCCHLKAAMCLAQHQTIWYVVLPLHQLSSIADKLCISHCIRSIVAACCTSWRGKTCTELVYV